MIFDRLLKKIRNSVNFEEDHQFDLIYQIHLNPKYLMYVDKVFGIDGEEVSYIGESVRGKVCLGDTVLVLDNKGETLAQVQITDIKVQEIAGKETMAGDKQVVVKVKGITKDICYQGQMLAVKGEE